MRIDPAIAALRADAGLQRQAQRITIAACAAWREEPATAVVLSELESFGHGAPLAECPHLEALVTGPDAAADLTNSLSRTMAGVLAAEPFGHPPFRHGFDGSASTLLLARTGRAQLVLHAREPGSYSFLCAGFSDALRYEAVLSGTAKARIVRRVETGFEHEDLALRPSSRLALDLASETSHVLQVGTRLVSLRLHRFAADPRPSREYDLATGQLTHQSSGDLGASRRLMMLAVLGRMKCASAASTMAAMALEEGDPSLRWQALRECLALDTETGFRALIAVARSAEDPLCAPAGALRAQLIEAHPQLLTLETRECLE